MLDSPLIVFMDKVTHRQENESSDFDEIWSLENEYPDKRKRRNHDFISGRHWILKFAKIRIKA